MALFFFIALVSGRFYVPVQSSDQLLYVYINADFGNDGQDCLMSDSTLKHCQTLSFVAENMTQRHYLVRIEIVSDRLDLTQPVEFNSWEGLTINGSGTLIHCNGTDAGIAFVNVKDLVIHSVTMTNVELRETALLLLILTQQMKLNVSTSLSTSSTVQM